MKINVLGTKYTVKADNSDPMFAGNSDDGMALGYCSDSEKKIVILEDYPANADYLRAHTLRHELVHAFMFECGLTPEMNSIHTENTVDWIATMFPKLLKAFERLECV